VRFGAHVSIAGKIYLAVDRAAKRGCQAMQIFSGNPRSWQSPKIPEADLEEFKIRREKAEIEPLILHLPYLVNLGSPIESVYIKSIDLMSEATRRARQLQAAYLVFHVGSHRGAGKENGLLGVSRALAHILERDDFKGQILLENTAGQKYALGSTFEELRFILSELSWSNRIGVCFDTCHGFAAGYDVSSEDGLERTLSSLDEMVGLERLKVLHANDCKAPLASRIDRHEHIGWGFIGLEGFKGIVNHTELKGLPCILETPRMTYEEDVRNLFILKSLVNAVGNY